MEKTTQQKKLKCQVGTRKTKKKNREISVRTLWAALAGVASFLPKFNPRRKKFSNPGKKNPGNKTRGRREKCVIGSS